MNRLSFPAIVLVLGGLAGSLTAQLEQVEELKPGVDAISEAIVSKTVKFLSSDEMRGRDTPSPELKKAAEFVASRFEKAGLAGGAKNGSFFQVASIATTSLPKDGIKFSSSGADIQHFGLMGAGQSEFKYAGKIAVADWETSKTRYDGPVVFEAGDVISPSEQIQVARKVGKLKRRGATAILIQVEPDSPLIATAARNGLPRIINPRERYSAPTLLVAKIDPNLEYELTIPKIEHGQTDVRNVIGLIEGSDPGQKEEALIFSAHLDHIGQQAGLPDPVFNGADDNATGVTGVLSLADAYAVLPSAPKRTVIFMTFWGEERGLLGSRHFVENPTWPLEKTVANINLEMLGRPEPGGNGKCWMTGWGHSDLGLIMAAGSRRIGVEIFEHPSFSNMLYQASDNASFVRKGVVAHSFSAGSVHSDYHQPGDEWEKLEMAHMTKVIRGLFVGSYPIANSELTPKKTDKRR